MKSFTQFNQVHGGILNIVYDIKPNSMEMKFHINNKNTPEEIDFSSKLYAKFSGVDQEVSKKFFLREFDWAVNKKGNSVISISAVK